MASPIRPRWQRAFRSPFFWAPFLLALVFHPGIPLTALLWTDFEAIREHALQNSVRARQVEPGVLEVDYQVVVMQALFARDTDDGRRHARLRLQDLRTTEHALTPAARFVDPSTPVHRPQGFLPVYDTTAQVPAWVLPEEECILLREGPHWKPASPAAGTDPRVATMDLGLWREGPLPGRTVIRIVGTPICLAADLFGLPRIALAAFGWGRAMRRIH
jgi:hypothetical protein